MASPRWTQKLRGGPKASPLEYLPASTSATARSGSVSIRLGTCTSPTPTSACSKSAPRAGWPLKVRPEGGLATLLATEAEGVRFNFTNDLDLDDEGNIYFTDSSIHYQRRL